MENKRQQLLDKALQMFVERGFHGTSTANIAKEANVATGTLFHYFKTKEELINVLYIETKQKFIEYVFSGVHPTSTLKNRIRKMWLLSLNYALLKKNEHRFLLQYCNSPYLNSGTLKSVDTYFENFYKPIEEGISSGILADLPIKFIYNLASHHIFAMVEYLDENPEKKGDKKFIDSVYQTFWKAIST